MAHSQLAGDLFSQLNPHQSIILIYGDGQKAHYRVNHLEAYQAAEPIDPYSEFISMQDGSRWSSQALFFHIYASGPDLVMQTCFEQDGQGTGGRLFVIAHPVHSISWKGLFRVSH